MNSKPSLVQELQSAALNSATPADDLLRMALVVARKLDVGEIEGWLTKELEGYDRGDELPSYRVLMGQVKGFNRLTGQYESIELRDERVAEAYRKRKMWESVSQLQHLVAEHTGDGAFYSQTETGAENLLKNIIRRNTPSEIGVFLQASQFKTILSIVRTRVLQWATQLEKSGVLGEGMTFTKQEQSLASNVTNMIFHGPVSGSQIQQNSPHAQQQLSAGLDIVALNELILLLESREKELAANLDAESFEQLKADVKSIEIQLSAPKPKQGILREAVHSVRAIIEGATGAGVYEMAMSILHRLAS